MAGKAIHPSCIFPVVISSDFDRSKLFSPHVFPFSIIPMQFVQHHEVVVRLEKKKFFSVN